MSTQTLLASAGFALITSAVFSFIGYRLGSRKVPHADRFAVFSFAAFWIGLAVSTLLGQNGLMALLAAYRTPDLGVALFLTQVGLVAISVALWGLLYYLIYLYTGRRSVWIPLAVFYLAFFVFLEYFIIDGRPDGMTVDDWGVNVHYANYPDPTVLSPLVIALIIAILVPQMLAAIAYLTLAFRVESKTQKYRIMLVSFSILVWFGSPFVTIGAGVAQADWAQLVSRFIGLAAAITIFLAYHPPGWIKRRYGILSLSDESPSMDATAPQELGPGSGQTQRAIFAW